MKYAAMLAIAALTLGIGTMSAQACDPFANKGAVPTRLPASLLARNNAHAPARHSIVGLWHVVHTDSSGNFLFEGFDLWHSDGTEEEMANLPPATGPVCFGVWTQNGKTIELLTHVAFTYDLNNNFTGTINLTEANKMSKDGNSFSGTFDLKQYDADGNLVGEATGTSAADRLD
ncbi:MAG TPA: hypothetical protein VGF97_04250 [Rhizomicrobium sp.]